MADNAEAQKPQRGNTKLPFPVVGIGASAGGLEVFSTFLKHLHTDSGMAFILVQHLDPSHQSQLAELLSRHTDIPVADAEDGAIIQPDRVYVIPAGHDLSLRHGRLHVRQKTVVSHIPRAIDSLFQSLAEHQQEHAIGIVLSGTGNDGTAGLRQIQALGGLTIAQDPASAEYDGMPTAAIAAGVVDRIAAVTQMPELIRTYLRQRQQRQSPEQQAEPLAEHQQDAFDALLELLRTQHRLDFRPYKEATLIRRVERRMDLGNITRLEDYLQQLHQDPKELAQLASELTIGVTGFFRDPQIFDELEQQLVKPLVDQVQDHQDLRIWVPGCATGEEAYSLAVLFHQEIERQQRPVDLQVFASDIDENALQQARLGRYSLAGVPDASIQRLARYGEIDNHGFLTLRKRLRESIIFTRQNLLTDPPFSQLNLISCRNLMIYLKSGMQEKLIRLFHFALRAEGYLLLGNAETIGAQTELFEEVSRRSH